MTLFSTPNPKATAQVLEKFHIFWVSRHGQRWEIDDGQRNVAWISTSRYDASLGRSPFGK